jgi:hypothetical protein
MKRSILFDKIHYYEDIIADPKDLVDRINDLDSRLVNSAMTKWIPWVASNSEYVFGSYKTSRFLNLPVATEVDREVYLIINEIKNAIDNCVNDYSEYNNLDLGYMPDECNIRRYELGKQMGPHIDCEDDDTESRLTASIVFYLNDDYEGGEISFPKQDIKIKPTAGSLVIFPSVKPYYHQSAEITSGMKYMCPAFMFRSSKVV